MKASVRKIEMPMREGVSRWLYEVVCTVRYGNNSKLTTSKSYGVYEKEDVANYIASCIREGKIIP